jgi:hypothetical protein
VVIGTFFLVAGLFLPASLTKHGYRRFVSRRLLHLGGPYAVFALLLWPLLLWLTYRAAGRHVSYWWVFAERPPLLDAGALWFTGVLLIFSLGYAGAVRAGLLAVKTGTLAAGPLRARHVVAIAAAVAVSTFLVRLWLPAKASLPGDLHLWEWPQCLGLLALGVFGSWHGLLRTVPDTIRGGCGAAVLVALLSVPVVAVATGVHSVAGGLAPYLGGWGWPALYAAAIEGVLAVAGSLWLLAAARRHLSGHGPLATAAAQAAYAAYLLQGPVLLALALAARPLALPALVKAPAVGVLGELRALVARGRPPPIPGSCTCPTTIRPRSPRPCSTEPCHTLWQGSGSRRSRAGKRQGPARRAQWAPFRPRLMTG